jgi:acyl-CoA reductase-like NAD-dependent aldehyde dehydrogenase
MQAAAKKLIRVVLELGGKSPVIVDEHAESMRKFEPLVAF